MKRVKIDLASAKSQTENTIWLSIDNQLGDDSSKHIRSLQRSSRERGRSDADGGVQKRGMSVWNSGTAHLEGDAHIWHRTYERWKKKEGGEGRFLAGGFRVRKCDESGGKCHQSYKRTELTLNREPKSPQFNKHQF